MKYLLTLTLLLLTLLPQTANAAKRPDAHPINIAALLVEKTDSAKVASTLEYYGYTPQGTEEGYQIMKDSKGNEIRYTFSETTSSNRYPVITVKTRDLHKSIDTRLKEMDFDKSGNGYERKRNMYSEFKTKCTFGPHSTLIFRRIRN